MPFCWRSQAYPFWYNVIVWVTEFMSLRIRDTRHGLYPTVPLIRVTSGSLRFDSFRSGAVFEGGSGVVVLLVHRTFEWPTMWRWILTRVKINRFCSLYRYSIELLSSPVGTACTGVPLGLINTCRDYWWRHYIFKTFLLVFHKSSRWNF